MAEHPGIRLVVIRFVVEPGVVGEISRVDVGDNTKSVSQDEEFLEEFKLKTAKDDSVTYEKKTVTNAAEAVATIRESNWCNMFLVGARPEGELSWALERSECPELERSECPELGPVGGLLASQDFPTTASVLVMQQYHNGVPLNFISEMEERSPDVSAESA